MGYGADNQCQWRLGDVLSDVEDLCRQVVLNITADAMKKTLEELTGPDVLLYFVLTIVASFLSLLEFGL